MVEKGALGGFGESGLGPVRWHVLEREGAHDHRQMDLINNEAGIRIGTEARQELLDRYTYEPWNVNLGEVLGGDVQDALDRGAGVWTRSHAERARELMGRQLMEIDEAETGEADEARACVRAVCRRHSVVLRVRSVSRALTRWEGYVSCDAPARLLTAHPVGRRVLTRPRTPPDGHATTHCRLVLVTPFKE